MTSLQEFTLFPLLPTELRLQIWRHACAPRITVLSYDPCSNAFRCPTPPPVLMQVCHESRVEAQRVYARCYLESSALPLNGRPQDEYPHKDFKNNSTTAITDSRRYFYHHPEQDTLYVPRPSFRSNGYSSWVFDVEHRLPWVSADVVRRLGVDFVPPTVRRPWEVYNKVTLMRSFKGLEMAYMVIGAISETTSGAAGDSQHIEVEGKLIQLVDPRADDSDIRSIMQRVRESFVFELREDLGLSGLGRRQADERATPGPASWVLDHLAPKVICA
jgi:hypothetical protein